MYRNDFFHSINCLLFISDDEEFIHVCNNQTTILNKSFYLVYTGFVQSVKDCQCFVKNNMTTMFLNDIRLQQRTVKSCSAAKLQINNVQFLCDDRKETFGSRFREEFGETSTRAYISLTDVAVAGIPRIIWLIIKPQGR